MSTHTIEKSVGELVTERPSRARLFERLGIDYCCGGKKLLDQACRDKHLDVVGVLKELQDEEATDVAPQDRNWSSASLTDLCDHIEQTHHAYLKQELPRLDHLTRKIAAVYGDREPSLREVQRIFEAFSGELTAHMAKEEGILFPLCRRLDRADQLPPPFRGPGGGIANPIEVMIREHEHAGDALAQIRALTNGFTCPSDACNTYRVTFAALEQLERDLHHHVHKENNILFPKAVRLERLLRRIGPETSIPTQGSDC
jgi:regulator of cell morphogenesis and NO signaling